MTFIQLLRKIKACQEAREWVESRPNLNPEELWYECENPEWLMWISACLCAPKSRIVAAACSCVQDSMYSLRLERGLENELHKPIELAKRWVDGMITTRILRDSLDSIITQRKLKNPASLPHAYLLHATRAAAEAPCNLLVANTQVAVQYSVLAVFEWALERREDWWSAQTKIQQKCCQRIREEVPWNFLKPILMKRGVNLNG